MPDTPLASNAGRGNDAAPVEPAQLAPVEPVAKDGAVQTMEQTRSPWSTLNIAVIDDAMHPPRLEELEETERVAVVKLLTTDAEVQKELAQFGIEAGTSVEKQLVAIARMESLGIAAAKVGEISSDALRMIEEHRTFNGIVRRLRAHVGDVVVCDPFQEIPDLSGCGLVLLDYYLHGPSKRGDLAIELAATIRGRHAPGEDQQIVLMSSIEGVRALRGEFREKAGVTGSAFAFVGKGDLNEEWKVKAHLGMLERARPYGSAFAQYRSKLEQALTSAKNDLLGLVDDLDIGDYAFLQGHALMKDGHPLGDYIFWLLSAQLMALGFEGDEMRERQRALDKLEFVGEPFASTEPSTVVAKLLNSALVSRNIGPLGPHPRAKPDGKYANFPLVQLGDVFLDERTTKAIVVMSADCDLAFSPVAEREPDADTPVLLVPGTPNKLKEASDDPAFKTEGILHREEVYRIVWEFAKYRAVALGELDAWLRGKGYDVSNRGRLRPLFALKLQQEFGAHLLRVGPPILPPLTTPAKGRILICISPVRDEIEVIGKGGLMLTRFKGKAFLRLTTTVIGQLKAACEDLLVRLTNEVGDATEKAKADLARKVQSLRTAVGDDQFWIGLLKEVELNAAGSVKASGPLGFVVGTDWANPTKPLVMLEILEDVLDSGVVQPPQSVQPLVEGGLVLNAVSEA